ncbi:MAG: DUF374 domain-containing protein [Parachlamydia sp.]|nr:DUF374 domain-containing protein [Parachlamydia sp.]
MKKILAYILAYLAKATVWLLFRTCRVEIKGLERFIEAANRERCILMLWHNRLGLIPEILKCYAPQFQYVAFVSNSRDGEVLSILTHSYAFGRAIRVPSHIRHHALKVSIDCLKEGKEVLIFTPDGPRGPRYQVKPGISLAARTASAHVVPLTWKASRCWRLNTWDGFILPKPFARLQVELGEPIPTSKELYPELDALTVCLENRLGQE